MPFITEQYSKIHPVSMEQFNTLQALTVGLLVVLFILVFIASMVFIHMQKQIDFLKDQNASQQKQLSSVEVKATSLQSKLNKLSLEDIPNLETKVAQGQDSLARTVVILNKRFDKLEGKQND